MQRKIWAFVAFNVYSITLLSAFELNTPYLLDASLVLEAEMAGVEINPLDWGWGPHYFWRLFSGAIVTGCVAILSGAIAGKSGGKITAISNIPSIVVWAVLLGIIVFGGIEVEEKTGFIVVSLIAIPLTTYLASIMGTFGEELQK